MRTPEPQWLQEDSIVLQRLAQSSAFYLDVSRDDIVSAAALLMSRYAKKERYVDWRFAIFAGLVALQFYGVDSSRLDYDATSELIRRVRDENPLRQLGAGLFPFSGEQEQAFLNLEGIRNPDYPVEPHEILRCARRNRQINEVLTYSQPQDRMRAQVLSDIIASGELPTGKVLAAMFNVSVSKLYRERLPTRIREAIAEGSDLEAMFGQAIASTRNRKKALTSGFGCSGNPS